MVPMRLSPSLPFQTQSCSRESPVIMNIAYKMATLFASISTDINRTSLIIIGVVASILTLALLYLMITRQSPARNDFEHLTPIGKWERSFGLDIQQPRRRRTHGFDDA